MFDRSYRFSHSIASWEQLLPRRAALEINRFAAINVQNKWITTRLGKIFFPLKNRKFYKRLNVKGYVDTKTDSNDNNDDDEE